MQVSLQGKLLLYAAKTVIRLDLRPDQGWSTKRICQGKEHNMYWPKYIFEGSELLNYKQ